VLITLATQRTTHLIGAGHAVPQALTEGFRLAYLIGAVLCAAAAVFTFVTVPKPAVGPTPAARLVPLAVGVAVVIGAFIVVDFAFGGSHGAPIGDYTTGSNTYSFVSQAEPASTDRPRRRRAQRGPAAAGRHLHRHFYDLTKPPIVGQSGPLIYDNHLSARVVQAGARGRPGPATSASRLPGPTSAVVVAGLPHQHGRDSHRPRTSVVNHRLEPHGRQVVVVDQRSALADDRRLGQVVRSWR